MQGTGGYTPAITSNSRTDANNRMKMKNTFGVGLLRFKGKRQWSTPFGSRAFAGAGASVLPITLGEIRVFCIRRCFPCCVFSPCLPGERSKAIRLIDFTQGLKEGYLTTFKCRPHIFSTSDTHNGMWAKFQHSSFHNCSYLTKWALLISESPRPRLVQF